MEKNRHLQKKRRNSARRLRMQLNIGTIIYIAVFLYLIIRLILYFTEDHVTSYQVISGPLSSNETYTALALREETVVYADAEGKIRYYVPDGAKTGKGSPVCTIGDTGASGGAAETTPEQNQKIKEILSEFASDYNPDVHSDTGSVKTELENVLFGNISGEAAEGVSRALTDGTVIYSTDGYESCNEEEIREEWFELGNYQGQTRISEENVKEGEPIYKLVTSETWVLALQVTDRQFAKLSTMTDVKVKFLKDGQTQNGSLQTKQVQGKNYAFITLQNGMSRYAKERFLNVELVTNKESGLKIPNTSIIGKEFYKIPTEYRTNGGDSNSPGFLREVIQDDGTISTEFVAVSMYTDPQEDLKEGEQPSCYYVDQKNLKAGDILVAPDSQKKYTVKETGVLKGVYSINQGYTVFRLICVRDQNEEFTIIEEGTSAGIDLYDYIAADASDVEENQIME